MAKPKAKKRTEMEFKSAFVSLKDAELGWSGTQGGRTVRVIFRDGAGKKVGELQISSARVRWWGARDKLPIKVSSRSLDDLFLEWHQKHSR